MEVQFVGLDELTQSMEEQYRQVRLGQVRLAYPRQRPEEVHRVTAPTLLVWGESDRLVPPSYAEDFRSHIDDAQVVILPECGHMPMFEKRDDFVALVTEFLTKQS